MDMQILYSSPNPALIDETKFYPRVDPGPLLLQKMKMFAFCHICHSIGIALYCLITHPGITHLF